MTSPQEATSISLDYLKGKRRAEKALGFLTSIGSHLLACDTREQVARTVADHLVRLDIAVCLLEYQPHTGPEVAVVARAADLEHEVPNGEEIVGQCRKMAERLAKPDAEPLEQVDTAFEVDGTEILLHRFALDHPDIGTGSISVGRLATRRPEFTPAELALLADVSARFLSTVRCLSE